MHPQAEDFIHRMTNQFPWAFDRVSVLEIGSHNINGSVRRFFKDPKEYIGVDLIDAPGVDLVGEGQNVRFDHSFDVTISTECFEHNPYWAETFRNMVNHTRPRGLILMTCASTGRTPHGLRESHPDDSPGTLARGWNYYSNLTEGAFASMPLTQWLAAYAFEYSGIEGDLYFWGIKNGL